MSAQHPRTSVDDSALGGDPTQPHGTTPAQGQDRASAHIDAALEHATDTTHAVAHSDPNNTHDQEVAIEQKFVDLVYRRLDDLRDDAQQRQRAGYEWREATVPGAQFERDVFVYRATKRIVDIDSQHEGLVFGRLDLDGGRVRHIGRLGVRDLEYRPLLIDWRAPAASPFYQATGLDRKGVARRRVIRSFGQTVQEVSDDLLDPEAEGTLPVIGDGALMAALTRKRTGRMRDIVATIQAEQDAAIRAPGRGATYITGGPGTGKTVVALHRAAYLLYQDRSRYEAAGILVCGPSAVFMRYIDRVLPSLGEETAALYSLGELYEGVEATRQDPPEVAELKGSLRIRPVLVALSRLAPPEAPKNLRIVYHGEVFDLDEHDLTEARKRALAKENRPNLAKTEAGRALLVSLWRKIKPVLPEAEPAVFSRDVGSRGEFLTFLDAWWPTLSPEMVLDWAADARHLAAAAGDNLTQRQVADIAATFQETDFSIQDVPLLDELRQLLGVKPQRTQSRDRVKVIDGVAELSTAQDRFYDAGPRTSRDAFYDGYAHIILDEAQDLTPMQWRMLGRRGKGAGWTIVGDEAQSSWPRPGEARHARLQAVHTRQTHEFHLRTNYRNSAEVFDYAAQWVSGRLSKVDLPEAVRSTGIPVREHQVDAHELLPLVASIVQDMLGAVEGTVGIIAPYARHEELKRVVTDERVSLVGPLESKGLEWDAVVTVDLEQIERRHGPGVAYVVLTRATQLLDRLTITQ
ncbi:HelD family protein [Natronoglycomyces albus]|uniref:AAA family ATPase n=1 Tax=Natronoglycomyces albus TaxID=2811108 RepID=A0A895XRX3_9ACTN|nr:AAA family ATPase [Natronoglycomyces albus]QSB05935.1 AAA family ATPase [Natronoglycomyces albus]